MQRALPIPINMRSACPLIPIPTTRLTLKSWRVTRSKVIDGRSGSLLRSKIKFKRTTQKIQKHQMLRLIKLISPKRAKQKTNIKFRESI